MHRWLVLAIAAVPILLSSITPPRAPGMVWWTTHALDKVRPYDPVPQEPKRSVKISAGRNEFEPFQLVLRADGHDLDGIDVDVTDLRGPGTALLTKNYISVYLEGYLDLKTPSSIDGGAGEWPDPLIPRVDSYTHEKRNAFPFKLANGRNQPVWLEVYVPLSAPPGAYHGQVQILISGKPQLSIPLDLEVWKFALPSTSSMVTTFGFNGGGALRQHFGKYTNDQQLYEMTFLYRKAALRHRISLHGGSMAPPESAMTNGRLKLKWGKFDNEIGPFMDGLVFSADEPLPGARATSEAVRTPPGMKTAEQQTEFWRQVAAHFREKGWIDRLFNYLWDEPKPNEYPAMVRLGQIVRQADPDIKNLVTAPMHREWSGFVDIWAPTINCFERKPRHGDFCDVTVDRTAYDAELAQGKQLWWYEACGTHGCNIVGGDYFRGWPSYMIDHDGVRNRIMEWLSWKYDIHGELYFNTNEAYFRKPDSWKDVSLYGGNGDGTLFYPGRPAVIGGTTDIPIESIRLKLIREGLEDYEYLVMLAKLAGSKTVGESVNSIVRKTYDFDHDPLKLYAVRESMGQALSRLSKPVTN